MMPSVDKESDSWNLGAYRVGLRTRSLTAQLRALQIALAGGIALLIIAAVPARATVTYDFAGSANGGSATDNVTVSGNASFTVGDGTISLTLTNTSPETISSNELLTGVEFTLKYNGTALTTAATYATATATPVTVTKGGAYSLGAAGTSIKSSWEDNQSGENYQLDFLLGSTFAIIGPPNKDNLYDTANSTIYNGNSAKNPFTADAATFNFTDTAITTPADLTITGVTFIYDTSCTYDVTGKQVSVVPERGAAIVFALGLTMACLFAHFSIFSKWRICGGELELQ